MAKAPPENAPMIGAYAFKEEELPFFTKAKLFVFNKNTGAVLGRTPTSWAKIIIFYVIFYTVLACVFSLLMLLLHYTLDPRIPKYKMDSSLIGTNPGLGFRPVPNDTNSLSTLIWYRGTKEADYKMWTDSLVDFLKEYKTPGIVQGQGAHLDTCSYAHPPKPGRVCKVDVRDLYPCSEENKFGYHLQKPCVFLKLNKIYGWKPEFWNSVEELPAHMPKSLKDVIKKETLTDKELFKSIWISCEGENPADVENIGEIKYHPNQRIPGYFFPYENTEGYLAPLVAVQFKNPKNGLLLNIECKAWAKNIVHDRKDRLGSVHFELLLD
ncbi:sodium/potassium-transporting ATPase subunit beta-2-like [Cimex lectularius]|uniref:Sodium/potassium-transporting ATPase subunit beta-2 n=1 Tax=Cimex lectularius TaxID=79782 RepID=A0A8I6RVW5_CIMLE|nr:sodium/potassium-transporting ATPase subunit beta-2-like [Cimex lectularius]